MDSRIPVRLPNPIVLAGRFLALLKVILLLLLNDSLILMKPFTDTKVAPLGQSYRCAWQ